jgi:hypothetical protein
MFLIVLVTGTVGFVFSFLMLKAGLHSMGIRYPVAVLLAYLVFLLLLRLWMSLSSLGRAKELSDAVVEACGHSADIVAEVPAGVDSGSELVGETISALDLDVLTLLLILVIVLCAGIATCVYVIWTAPLLLAEVFVDGIIMTAVYKRMRAVGQPYWAFSAIRRTWVPALLLAAFFSVAGFAMQRFAPDAPSIGRVVHEIADRN